MRHTLSLSLFLSLLLGGCATTECNDPGAGGLLGGVCGLASGRYEERIQEREQNLERLRQVHRQETTEQGRLQDEKVLLEQRVARLKAEAVQLDAASADLASQIQRAQAAEQGSRAQREALAKRLQSLRGSLKQHRAQVGKGGDDAELRRYEAEEKRLRREVEALKRDLYVLE